MECNPSLRRNDYGVSKTPEQIAASVRAQLKNKSRETNRDFQIILIHYGIERLIYRLSKSDYNEKFVLKGAMLFTVWGMPETRTTKDVDFLAFIKPDTELIRDIFIALCSMEIEGDAMKYHPDAISVSEIREDNAYGGIHVYASVVCCGDS